MDVVGPGDAGEAVGEIALLVAGEDEDGDHLCVCYRGFFVCGGLCFLLGFLEILVRICGVFVDSVWWIVWVRWFLDVRFLGG